ncbi:MAG TPA: YchJ family metal-binding protein [Rhodocyclaceae bacterium]|nr:YchJ family metal-binding protein [Rhodocyclaceae bacterium]
MKTGDPCPCGSGRPYGACCGPIHGGQPAASAEALMRSRYSAYVLGLEDYLLATWHPSTRPQGLDLAAEPAPKWLGLEVKRHQTLDDSHAVVEFVARYRVAGRGQRLHETSRFVRQEGRWFYVDGDFDGKASS